MGATHKLRSAAGFQRENSVRHQQNILIHQVFVLKKITVVVSALNQDFSEPSPRKQPPSPWVRESDSVQFTDGDYVIM